jgi:hypothetical protein
MSFFFFTQSDGEERGRLHFDKESHYWAEQDGNMAAHFYSAAYGRNASVDLSSFRDVPIILI